MKIRGSYPTNPNTTPDAMAFENDRDHSSLYHSLSATAIVIGFEETRYSMKETESVEVCLTVISGTLDLEEGDDITISCSSSGGNP